MSARRAAISTGETGEVFANLEALPDGWIWAKLGEVCKTTSGGTPSRKSAEYFTGDIPWVKSGELPDGLITEVEERITEGAIANSSAKLFPVGTLLIALYGATVGKLGILKEDATTNQAVCAVFPPEYLDTKYLFWYLRFVRSDLIAQAVGGAQPNISQRILRELLVPIAPLDQQKLIVAEIAKQFSRLDEAVADLKRVKANLKRYKAAVLKAAVEGRLVETEASVARREGRAYETGEQLLQRILEIRRSQWLASAEKAGRKGKGKYKGKYKEPAAPDTTDLPELPEGWTWCGFEQVSISDKHALKAGPFGSALKKDMYVESGYKIYGQEQVIRGDSTFGAYFINEGKYRELESCAVRPGDLLISLVGTAGKVLVLPPTAMPGIINPRLLKLSLDLSHISPQYAAYMLQSSWTAHYFKLQAHGGTMEILNLGIIKALPVPLPPIAEQYRIVAEVDRRLSLLCETETEIDANLRRGECFRQSILRRIFSRGL